MQCRLAELNKINHYLCKFANSDGKILYLTLAIVLAVSIQSCKNKEGSNIYHCTYKDSALIADVLGKQLKYGFAAEKYETDYPNYNYSQAQC